MKTELVRMAADRNPAAAVERFKEKAPEIRFLTLVQIDEQLHAFRFKPQLQIMVATLIYAGLRREELLWLTLDDVDLIPRQGGNGVIRVCRKTIDGQSWQPKTRQNRTVPISNNLRDYLDRYLVPRSEAKWFFPSPLAQRWDPDNFSAYLRHANQEASLRWSCLDYRHTFGSQLVQNGISLFKVATLLGNSPEICRRHYAALNPELMFADVEFHKSNSDHGGDVKYGCARP